MKVLIDVFRQKDSFLLSSNYGKLLIEHPQIILRNGLANIGFIELEVIKEEKRHRVRVTFLDAAGMTRNVSMEGLFEADQTVLFMSMLSSLIKGK